jgi:hypothetical protein
VTCGWTLPTGWSDSAATARVQTVYRGLTAGLEGDITTAGGAVLLRAGDGTVTRIDATSGRLLERIAQDTPLTGGGLIAAYDSLRLTSNDDGTLTRLRA